MQVQTKTMQFNEKQTVQQEKTVCISSLSCRGQSYIDQLQSQLKVSQAISAHKDSIIESVNDNNRNQYLTVEMDQSEYESLLLRLADAQSKLVSLAGKTFNFSRQQRRGCQLQTLMRTLQEKSELILELKSRVRQFSRLQSSCLQLSRTLELVEQSDASCWQKEMRESSTNLSNKLCTSTTLDLSMYTQVGEIVDDQRLDQIEGLLTLIDGYRLRQNQLLKLVAQHQSTICALLSKISRAEGSSDCQSSGSLAQGSSELAVRLKAAERDCGQLKTRALLLQQQRNKLQLQIKTIVFQRDSSVRQLNEDRNLLQTLKTRLKKQQDQYALLKNQLNQYTTEFNLKLAKLLEEKQTQIKSSNKAKVQLAQMKLINDKLQIKIDQFCSQNQNLKNQKSRWIQTAKRAQNQLSAKSLNLQQGLKKKLQLQQQLKATSQQLRKSQQQLKLLEVRVGNFNSAVFDQLKLGQSGPVSLVQLANQNTSLKESNNKLQKKLQLTVKQFQNNKSDITKQIKAMQNSLMQIRIQNQKRIQQVATMASTPYLQAKLAKHSEEKKKLEKALVQSKNNESDLRKRLFKAEQQICLKGEQYLNLKVQNKRLNILLQQKTKSQIVVNRIVEDIRYKIEVEKILRSEKVQNQLKRIPIIQQQLFQLEKDKYLIQELVHQFQQIKVKDDNDISRFTQEILHLKKVNATQHHNVQQLQRKLSQLQRSQETVERKCQKIEQQNKILGQVNSQLKLQLQKMKFKKQVQAKTEQMELRDQLQERLRHRQAEIASLTRQKINVVKQLDRNKQLYQNRQKESEQKLASLLKQLKMQRVSNDQLICKIQNLQFRIKELQFQNKEYKLDSQNKTKEQQDKEKEDTARQAELQSATIRQKTQRHKLQLQLAEANRSLSKAISERNKFQEKLRVSDALKDVLQSKLIRGEELRLAVQKEQAVSKVCPNNQQLQQLQRELTTTKQNLNTILRQVQSLSIQNKQLSHQVLRLKQIQKQAQLNKISSKQLQQLKLKNQHLLSQINQLSRLLDIQRKKQQRNEVITRQNKAEQRVKQQSTNERANLQSCIVRMQKQLFNSQQTILSLQEEVRSLKLAVSQRQFQANSFKRQSQEMSACIRQQQIQMKAQSSRLGSELAARKRVQVNETHQEDQQKRIKFLEQQLSRKCKELEQLSKLSEKHLAQDRFSKLKINQLQSRIKELTVSQQLTFKFRQLEQEHHSLNTMYVAAVSELACLKQQYYCQTSIIYNTPGASQVSQVSQSKGRLTLVGKTSSSAESQLSMLRDELQGIRRENEVLRSNQQQLRKEIQSLKKRITEQNFSSERFSHSFSVQRKNSFRLKQHSEIQGESQSFLTQRDYSTEQDYLQLRFKEQEQQLQHFRRLNGELEGRLSECNSKVAQLQNCKVNCVDVQRLTNTIVEMKEEMRRGKFMQQNLNYSLEDSSLSSHHRLRNDSASRRYRGIRISSFEDKKTGHKTLDQSFRRE